MAVTFSASTPGRGLLTIRGYSADGFRVGTQRISGSLLITPEAARAWPVTDLTLASLADFADVTAAEPSIEVLLLGTGGSMTRPPAVLLDALAGAGLRADFMDSRAAARTFNVLVAEDRRVAAALLAL